jgi:hypothetical protein
MFNDDDNDDANGVLGLGRGCCESNGRGGVNFCGRSTSSFTAGADDDVIDDEEDDDGKLRALLLLLLLLYIRLLLLLLTLRL